MVDAAARLLRLLSLLQVHQHWSGAALAARLEVTTRTVRVDVERLRSLGYQIHGTPGVGGGYRLRAGTALPPLLLEDDEAVAVAVGLQTVVASGVAGIGEAAARAAAKLEQMLPDPLRHRLRTVSAVTETIPSTRDPVGADILAAVAAACQRSEQLRFDYRDRHDASTRRQVEPHRLVHVSGRWYLVAYDLDRDEWRSFRGDRISPRTPTGPRFTPREPPAPDLGAFVTRGRMAALWSYRARVTVHAPADVVSARVPIGSWVVEPIDSHTSRLDAGAHSPELLAVYLGALGLDFHLDPDVTPDLAHAAATLATRYAAAPADIEREATDGAAPNR